MAHFDERMKNEFQPKIDEILNEYGVSGYLEVLHDNAVRIVFIEGKLNLNKETEIDLYSLDNYDDKCSEFLSKIVNVLDSKNYDVYDDEGIQKDIGYFVYARAGYHQKYVYTG